MSFQAIAILSVIPYVACYLATWGRIEHLRADPHAKCLLPDPRSFFTGSAILWVWSGDHREVGDRRLTTLVWLLRAVFALIFVCAVIAMASA